MPGLAGWLAGLRADQLQALRTRSGSARGIRDQRSQSLISKRVIDQFPRSRDDGICVIETRRNRGEAVELTAHVDDVQNTLAIDREVSSGRRRLAGQRVSGRSVSRSGRGGGHVELFRDGVYGGVLVRCVVEIHVGGVHGGGEFDGQSATGAVIQQSLADGEGRRAEGLDEVGDVGEDVGFLACRQY